MGDGGRERVREVVTDLCVVYGYGRTERDWDLTSHPPRTEVTDVRNF